MEKRGGGRVGRWKGEVGKEGIEVEGPRLKGAVVNWSNQAASDTNMLARKDGGREATVGGEEKCVKRECTIREVTMGRYVRGKLEKNRIERKDEITVRRNV